MKQYYLFSLACSIFFLLCCAKENESKTSDTIPDTEIPTAYQLVWNDEFNYDGLPDDSKWSYNTGGFGWGNDEAQYYTNARLKNAEVKGGYLHINAIKEDFEGKKYTSARLVTRTKGDWVYGKVEVRAKLPDGRGMWPAIWMLPTDQDYGGWPASGEIDIMENLGYFPYIIVATVQTQSYKYAENTHKNAIVSILDCYSEFHNYILEWETKECRFYIDSKLYFTFRNEGTGFQVWPFDKRFHLLLNVAIGGTVGGAMGIDDNIFPRSMVIDYVRVYQKI